VGEDRDVLLMRVTLPHHPGSLGAVASAMGTIGADIRAIHIVEKYAGVAVNDFVVELPPEQTRESLVLVCEAVEGVRVEWVASHPSGGNLQSDLETASQMVAEPGRAAEILAEAASIIFGSDWSLVVDTSGPPTVVFETAAAPQPDCSSLMLLGPFDAPHLVELSADWLPGQSSGSAAVVPLIRQHALVVGRAGPRFREPELVRLTHLATLVP